MKVRSAIQPQEITIVGNEVLVASNIVPFEEEIDGYVRTGYEYDCEHYNKDEYLLQQSIKISSLEEELAAAKVLLGVD